MFPAGLAPAPFRVLGGRDNHSTTETSYEGKMPYSVVCWSGIGSFSSCDQQDRQNKCTKYC